jgi:site-specific DNA-cytosine methylase
MLENVKMKREYLDVITKMLGVEPVLINSALVSAQNRQRYYWANWPISQPKDRGITCNDIIDRSDFSHNSEVVHKWWENNKKYQLEKQYSKIINNVDKAITMTARQVSSWNGNLVQVRGNLRFISLLEAERLQTMPDNYTQCEGVSNTQRYKMLGNGWTLETIKHNFNELKKWAL